MKPLTCLVIILFLLAMPSLSAEGEVPSPKTALVLSGGAAMGFAHVGVIRVLEEAGIPVDLVIGVSMGGLVGSLYAVGYSPRDMEKLSEVTDWRAIFSNVTGVTPYLTHPVIQTRQNILSMYFDSRGIGRSLGVLPDQRVVSHFSRFVYKVSHVRDFDAFHIPLRITGTDLITGEMKVFQNAPLPAVMRSTMAIPGLFSPYQVDGRYYIEGGVVNNLPISIARDLGADVIISVNTSLELKGSIDQFSSSMTVITQAAQHVLASILQNELQYSSLHIEVAAPGGTVMEFWKYRDFIKAGEDAARSQWDAIQKLAETIAESRPLEYRNPDRVGYYHSLPLPKVSGVEVDPSLDVPHFPLDLFKRIPSDDPSFRQRVENAANRLIASRSYESIGYSLRPYGGETLLSLYPVAFTRGKHYLGATYVFDGSYSSAAVSDAWRLHPGFSLDLVFSDILGAGSLLSLNFQLTESLHTNVSFSIPLTPEIYLRPFLTLGENGLILPLNELYTAAYLDIGQELGVQLRPYSRAGLSVHLTSTWVIGEQDDIPDPEVQLLFTPIIDVQNYEPRRFPYSGIKVKSFLELPTINPSYWYRQFSFELRHYIPLYLNGTIGYDLKAGSFRQSVGGAPLFPWHFFDMGGWNVVPGYVPNEKVFPDAVTAGASFYHRFSAVSGILGMDIYAAVQLRGGCGWQDVVSQPGDGQFFGGGAVGIGIDSVLGELVIGFGMNLKGNSAFYLLLN